MEAFSLLKYWRSSSSAINAAAEASSFTSTTTIVTADEESTDDDEGPFFDLEFAVPGEENREIDSGEDNAQLKIEDDCDSDESDGENGRDFEFALSSGSSVSGGEQSDPSDDLFFKGRLVSIDTSPPSDGADQHPKSLFLQKSATRLRILMLKLKKSKCNENPKTDPNGSAPVDENQESLNKPLQPPPPAAASNKFFTVKFKVEEVPIISLFTRDGSKSQKQQQQQKQIDGEIPPASDSSTSDEKQYLMQKYLKKVKPLYVQVSRRYADKLKFSGQLSLGSGKSPSPSTLPAANEDKDSTPPAVKPEKEVSEIGNVKGQKQGNLQAGLKIVYKHLGKSRSAAVAASPPPAAPSRRCDDSLMDQQDGIQGAILHCKRSFNSSRDWSPASVLARSVSDPMPTPPREAPGKS